MANHIWTVLCHRASIDRDSNHVSLLEVTETINLSGPVADQIGQVPKGQVPVFPVQMELVSYWIRSNPAEPEPDAKARYVLVGPTKKRFGQPENVLSLNKHTHTRHRLKINQFPMMGAGYYTWLTQVPSGKTGRWRTVARTPFEVTVVDTTEGKNGQETG